MTKVVKEMPYKEAWEKLQKDYFLAMGYLYRYMDEKDGENKVFDYLREVEVERFRKYYQTFSVKLVGILEKVLPAQVFEKKVEEVVKEFQFFIGVGNIEIQELNQDTGIVKIKECPYVKANADAPANVKVTRDIYCKFQCNGYIKDICNDVMGIAIEFAPGKVECIYTIRRKQ